jgi:hypothetical protein
MIDTDACILRLMWPKLSLRDRYGMIEMDACILRSMLPMPNDQFQRSRIVNDAA